MNSFQINNIVKVKTIELIKKSRHNGPVYSKNSLKNFHVVSTPTEIIGKIENIENGKYFVSLGDYNNGKFKPFGRTVTFTEIYMSRFARALG